MKCKYITFCRGLSRGNFICPSNSVPSGGILKVLIVMGHPAHVHFFRHYMNEMKRRGHEFKVCVKVRENTTKLLDLYGIQYEIFGKTYPDRPSKACGMILNDLRLIGIARCFKPDLAASVGGLYSVHAGAALGVPTIDYMDTENAVMTNILTFPLATVIATPDCYYGKVPKSKHRPYPGYHELAYLHPKRFKADENRIKNLGVNSGEYIIVRFSTLDASHQTGEAVLTYKDKIRLVRELSEYGKVLVDTEGELPVELKKHRLDIPEHHYHDVLAFAALYVGEGATAASEAGVLGVPWIFISGDGRGYLDDQERRYGIGATVDSVEKALEHAKKVFNGNLEPKKARKKLLEEKIDVTGWMIRLSKEFL